MESKLETSLDAPFSNQSEEATHEVTELLQAWRQGDAAAGERLVEKVYPLLRSLARRRLDRGAMTLQPTELVHEVYLKMNRGAQPDWQNRAHFLAISASLIRDVLVDHLRRKGSHKRGAGWHRLTLDTLSELADANINPDLLDLHEALERLAVLDPTAARLVELRFFGGLEIQDVVPILGLSSATLVRKWRYARAWLRRELATDRNPNEER